MTMTETHPEFVECPRCKNMARRSIRDDGAGRRFIGDLPRQSMAMAVLAHEKARAEQELADAGVQTRFEVQGLYAVPQFENRQHKNRAMRALGYGDRDAGWSDPNGR